MPTGQEPEISPELRARMHIWERVFELARLIVRSGTLVGVLWIAYLAIVELAGKTTLASFLFAFFSMENHEARTTLTPWALMVLCAIWAKIERSLRYKKTAVMARRIQELEVRIDPQRTGSNLTERGQTNPLDRG